MITTRTSNLTENEISYKGREVRWNSVWCEIMVSRTANLTEQSVFRVTRCSAWERPFFTPNAVSSHLFSLLLWIKLEKETDFQMELCKGQKQTIFELYWLCRTHPHPNTASFKPIGSNFTLTHRICRNKRPGRLSFKSNKKFQNPSNPIGFMCSPLWKITHQDPPVLCTPLSEKSPIKAIGLVYSPLWKITHQKPWVLCTPLSEKITVFDGRLFRGGRLFRQIR